MQDQVKDILNDVMNEAGICDNKGVSLSIGDLNKGFTVGDRVSHANFGDGRVTHVSGSKLTILFRTQGIKIIDADYVRKVPKTQDEESADLDDELNDLEKVISERNVHYSTQRPTVAEDSNEEIKVGDWVSHKNFGRGRVTHVNPSNLTILFPGQGLKIIDKEYIYKV